MYCTNADIGAPKGEINSVLTIFGSYFMYSILSDCNDSIEILYCMV